MATGLFKNMKDVKASGDFNYEGAGNYWMRIDRITQGKKRTGETFVAIVKTIIRLLPTNESGKLHTLGEEVSHFMPTTGKNSEYFLPNFKQFVVAVFAANADTLTDDDYETIMAKDGEMVVGMVVEMNNKTRATKVAGKFRTSIDYERQVPAKEVFEALSPELVDRFFPNNYLQKIIAAEEAEAK